MIGQKLGSFRIEAKIGSGAMGAVYRAIQEPKGRVAAVKVIAGEYAQKGDTALRRFNRESEILQQLRHPNIVRCLAVGRSQGTLYFAMEFIAGGTLQDLIQRRGYLPWRETVELGIQICDALHYAHEHGVIHRDLKPSNLMVTETGQVKLTDFGIAKDLDATALTGTGRTLGTAAYMAPEQIRGTPEISHKTDLYALGCVLYQMLTGDPPFPARTAVSFMHAHLNTPPPRPSTKNPEIPVELDNLIVRLMAKDPAQRPWDAVAVGHALTELRDKALRGDPIPMVFTAVDAPTRAELTTPGGSSLAGATRSGVRTKGGKAGRKGRGRLLSRRTLETAGLAAALVGVSALLAYLLWPPSAAYQFRKAEELMASSDPTRWAIAKDQYIDDLRRRFPDYRPQEVQAWLDRIALNRAERRAYVLEHPSVLASSQPKTDAEDLYVRTYKHVEEAEKIGLDVDALRLWSDMARVLQEHHPEDRGWILLAQQKAEAVRKTLESRRAAVLQALRLAVAADRAGRTEEALRLRRDVLKQYGQYPELADLIRPLRLLLPLEEEEKAAPEKSETEAEAKAKEAAQPPGPGEAPTP